MSTMLHLPPYITCMCSQHPDVRFYLGCSMPTTYLSQSSGQVCPPTASHPPTLTPCPSCPTLARVRVRVACAQVSLPRALLWHARVSLTAPQLVPLPACAQSVGPCRPASSPLPPSPSPPPHPGPLCIPCHSPPHPPATITTSADFSAAAASDTPEFVAAAAAAAAPPLHLNPPPITSPPRPCTPRAGLSPPPSLPHLPLFQVPARSRRSILAGVPPLRRARRCRCGPGTATAGPVLQTLLGQEG